MGYPEVILKRGRERWVLEGHPWVFPASIDKHPMSVESGGLIDLLDRNRNFLARGYYNPVSSIPVRILTRNQNQEINRSFLTSRIWQACDWRRRWIDEQRTTAYRIVHGENDGLPGLIVDKYQGFLVVQFHTLGMDLMREMVIESLQEVICPDGIYERSDVGTRRGEGMEEFPVRLLIGAEPPPIVEVLEHGLKFFCDLRKGQKTGFFLDQRENRLAVQSLVKRWKVLNCFSYSGGFSVYAARGGASKVISVDTSEVGIELARKNLEHNRFDPNLHPCIISNVFDYLKFSRKNGNQFDMVILDPPAFVKTKRALDRAIRAYINLNRSAIQVLRPGGMLVSSSCSTLIDYETFFNIIRKAAIACHRDFRIVRGHLQAVDHPVTVTFPEGRYLKSVFGIVG